MLPIVRYALLSAVAGLFALGCVWDQYAPPGGQADLVLESFEVFKDGDALVVPVTFEGRPYPFLVDTGATWTAYDKSFAARLGNVQTTKTAGTGSGSSLEVKMYKAPTAFLGRLSLESDTPVAVFDLTKLCQAADLDFAGVLGMDFLAKHIVRFDPDRGRLEFLRAVGKNPGAEFDLGTDQSIPTVAVHLTDISFDTECLIDTGCCGGESGDLAPIMLRMLEGGGKAVPVGENVAVTASGDEPISTYRLDHFGLGDFQHRGLYFSSSKGGQKLGLGYLRRYVVTFDFPNHKMYLKKSKQFDDSDYRNRSGMHMDKPDGRVVIRSIEREGPADKAGLKAGDVVLKIGGVATETQRLHLLAPQAMRTGENG